MDAFELTSQIKPHAVAICRQSNGGCERAANLIRRQGEMAVVQSEGNVVQCKEAFDYWMALQTD